MTNELCNIVFGGIGGQGILKASEICGWAAMFDGWHVKKSEVHGMAQRGGSVESHLRFGKEVYSPLVGKGGADYLVCFHQAEHERLSPFLKPDGSDLILYLDQVQGIITNPRHLNTCLVGVLSSFLSISNESWDRALERVFKKKILDENKEVFSKGAAIVKKS